jgi:RNA polymerase-binding transcription factor DksA
MDKKQLDKQLGLLNHLREKLVKKVDALKRLDDIGESADDNALEVSETTTNLSLKKDLSNEIKLIDKAIAAINSGKYGICQTCKTVIEDSRLKLVPMALNCSSCQNKVDKK